LGEENVRSSLEKAVETREEVATRKAALRKERMVREDRMISRQEWLGIWSDLR